MPPEIVCKLTEYPDQRLGELFTAKLQPNPPLWIRNRADDRLVLVADAWLAREMLERANAKVSGKEVLRWLEADGRVQSPAPRNFVKRVEEALRRVDQLLEEGKWPQCGSPEVPELRQPGYGLHPAAVFQVLEEEEE